MWRRTISVVPNPDPTNNRKVVLLQWKPNGLYFYHHWRQEGRQHTQYLGHERPADFPEEDTPPHDP